MCEQIAYGVYIVVERLPFTDCTQLPLTVEVDSDVFVYDTNTSVYLPADGMSCTLLTMVARRSGHTVVKASYIQDDIQLMATVTIAAFDPLVVRCSYVLFDIH